MKKLAQFALLAKIDMSNQRTLIWPAYGISLSAALLAFLAWGQGLRWQFSLLSSYRLFPLLGLLAVSLMWSMYGVGFLQRHFKLFDKSLKSYYRNLSLPILVLICLHPGLLVWQLWRDGFGWPPSSYLSHYVAPAARWAALLSSAAWLVFLASELRRKYSQRKWWKKISILADLALVAIFIHSLKLGNNLQHGWFRYVWLFYAASLIYFLADSYVWRYRQRQVI